MVTATATVVTVFECANCAETADLLRCSRCHAAFFCSRTCQRAYWPFHRMSCQRNEFADAVEDAEPKFASWMRDHGKLAILKDDEPIAYMPMTTEALPLMIGHPKIQIIDMSDSTFTCAHGHAEPSYTAEEMKAMRLSHQQSPMQTLLAPAHIQAWEQIQPASDLGQDCSTYKWSQTQTEVSVFVQLPEHLRRHEVLVELTPSKLLIKLGDKVILSGQLYSDVKQEESIWLLVDRILHLTMLKRNRRGNYANHCTNADTFWKSVMKHAPQQEWLKTAYPPSTYYALAIEDDISRSQPGRLEAQHMQVECSTT